MIAIALFTNTFNSLGGRIAVTKAEKKIARMLNSLGSDVRIETRGEPAPANYYNTTEVAKHLVKHGWRVQKLGES